MAGGATFEIQAQALALDFFMNELEMTNAELQRRMGFAGDSTIGRYRKGERRIDFDTALALCKELNVDPVEFFEVAVGFARGHSVAA